MSMNDPNVKYPDNAMVVSERYRENLEVALMTLLTVCRRWHDAPIVVLRAVDVASHVLRTGLPPALNVTETVDSPGYRYMNQSSKALELDDWARAKAARESAPPSGFVGGHGYPDPEIYDWVDRLNDLHRVCTLQSCAGHVCTPELMCDWCAEYGTPGPATQHIISGQLWLWLDEPLSHWFRHHAPTLAANPLIEKVTVLYHVEGKEIVDIVFKGAGSGDLDASMRVIVKFFEDGNCACNLG